MPRWFWFWFLVLFLFFPFFWILSPFFLPSSLDGVDGWILIARACSGAVGGKDGKEGRVDGWKGRRHGKERMCLCIYDIMKSGYSLLGAVVACPLPVGSNGRGYIITACIYLESR